MTSTLVSWARCLSSTISDFDVGSRLVAMKQQGCVGQSNEDLRPSQTDSIKSSECGRHFMQSKSYSNCPKNATDLVKRKSGGARKLFRKRRSLQSTNGFLLDDGGAEIAVQCGIHSNIDFKVKPESGSSCSWPFSNSAIENDVAPDSSCSDSSPSPGEDRVIFELNTDVCCLYCPPVVLADGQLRSRSANRYVLVFVQLSLLFTGPKQDAPFLLCRLPFWSRIGDFGLVFRDHKLIVALLTIQDYWKAEGIHKFPMEFNFDHSNPKVKWN